MKKDIKKVLAISILSMGVISLAPSALGAPHSANNTQQIGFENYEGIYIDHHQLTAGEDRNSHINTFTKDMKTLIYYPGSFDVQRFHDILRINGVDSTTPNNNGREHEWYCVKGTRDGNYYVKYIKNYNEPLDSPLRKTIIFFFNPSSMFGGANENIILRYSNFLTDCGFAANDIIKLYFNNIKVPEGARSIGQRAFEGCTSLEKIEIPQGIRSIGSFAFSICTSLKEIEIPQGVELIGPSAFEGCTSLEKIEIPGSVKSIGEYVFFGCNALKEVRISEGVKSIGFSAFNGCKSLKRIEIPQSVESISPSAFEGCESLSGDIYILNNAAKIGEGAFSNCTSIKGIHIPSGSLTIGDYAFEGCTSLERITISQFTKSIGDNAFEGCDSLKTIKWGTRIYRNVNSFLSDFKKLKSAF